MRLSSSLPWISSLLAVGLTFGLQAGDPSEETGGEPDVAPEVIAAADLWEDPASYLGQIVAIEVQMHSSLVSWNPMLTRYGPGRYQAFLAWSDEQFPWIEGDYENPQARLFALRGSAAEWALEGADVYSRFQLMVRVTSNFAGTPWVEVLAVKPKPRHLQDGAVIHATNGTDLMMRGLWNLAIEEFERANVPGIPANARLEFETLIEICRSRLPIPPPGELIKQ